MKIVELVGAVRTGGIGIVDCAAGAPAGVVRTQSQFLWVGDDMDVFTADAGPIMTLISTEVS
ncbi:hypothetical protein ACFSUH_00895 [Rhodococcus jostii]|uniref:Uncharacterized protein n=2 Tax=Rhodococcus jostii TaxID=132919 RepID=A0A1H4ISR9_RHOJO|nr:hypothetical protein SAMN04490220_0473 [Rhodococcus jostii]